MNWPAAVKSPSHFVRQMEHTTLSFACSKSWGETPMSFEMHEEPGRHDYLPSFCWMLICQVQQQKINCHIRGRDDRNSSIHTNTCALHRQASISTEMTELMTGPQQPAKDIIRKLLYGLVQPRAWWYQLRGLRLVSSECVYPQCYSSFVFARGSDTPSAMDLPVRITRSQEHTRNANMTVEYPD